MKILWDLKILRETGSRKAKILWDFVSQCEVWHVWYLPKRTVIIGFFHTVITVEITEIASVGAQKWVINWDKVVYHQI